MNLNRTDRILPFLTCRVNELQDPTYRYKVDIANFEVRTLVKLYTMSLISLMKWESKMDKKQLFFYAFIPYFISIL